jgi:subtilisin family serine protease
VANFSLGGSVSSALNSELTNMIAAGVQTAVSAGNDAGDACTKSPASAAAAVTVGATTSSDARASYSNFGSCVDVFAPGSGITSASYSSQTGSVGMSGTSMAAPHATGVLALLRAQRTDMTSQQLRDWLVELSAKNIVVSANSTNAHLLQSLTGSNSGPVAPPPEEPVPPPPPPPPPPPAEPVAPTAPSAPASLKASVVAKIKVKVQWSDVSTNESGFTVERRVGAGEWAKIATVAANATSYQDASTTKGQTYTYRAFAFNGVGNSPSSNESSVTVGASTRPTKN